LNYDISSIMVLEDQSILEILKAINDSASKFALVVDETKRLVGIVTDGDIRRGLLKGRSVNDPVRVVMNPSPVVARDGLTRETMLSLLNEKISMVPVVGEDGRVKGILSFKDKNVALDVKSRRICVVGLGYVGLTLSVVLAEIGFKVFGFDIDAHIIKLLNDGRSHFHENGLEAYLHRNLGKRLFPVNYLDGIDADVYMIAVGTPVDKETKLPDLSCVETAATMIGRHIKSEDLVILRSTVPIGTTRRLVLPALNTASGLRAGTDYFLSFAPERTAAGIALPELRELPQIIGGYDKKSAALTSRLFGEITSTIIDVGSLEAAEMVKIMNNTFRDVKFAYANEMALICKELGLDMHQLVQAANDSYDRDKIPVPSPGVGGPCLTKDGYLLQYSCKDLSAQPTIVGLSRQVNESIPFRIAREIDRELKRLGKKSVKIFVIGFAFKGEPETSDTRDSATLALLKELRWLGYPDSCFFGYDAVAGPGDISQFAVTPVSLAEGFEGADAVIIMNNHKSHRVVDIFTLLMTTKKPCLFVDGWRTFDPRDIKEIEHLVYLGVGCR